MNQINFLPTTFVQQRVRKHRVFREFGWIILTLAVMGGWFYKSRGGLHDQELYAQSIDAQVAAMEDQKTEAVKLQTQQRAMLEQLRMQRGLGLPLDVTAVMGTLAKLMPATMALTDLEITTVRPTPEPVVVRKPGEPAPTKVKVEEPIAPLKVEMVGLAPADTDVADFVGRLSGHPLFTNVKMVFSRATQAASLQAREFRIEMEVPLDCDYKPAGAVAQEVAHAN